MFSKTKGIFLQQIDFLSYTFLIIRNVEIHFSLWLDFRKKFHRLCREFNEYTRLIPLTFLLGFYVSNVVSRLHSSYQTVLFFIIATSAADSHALDGGDSSNASVGQKISCQLFALYTRRTQRSQGRSDIKLLDTSILSLPLHGSP